MDSSNYETELSINSQIIVGLENVCVNNYRGIFMYAIFLESSPYDTFVVYSSYSHNGF